MPTPESAQFFAPAHRRVYSFHDGVKARFIDPLAVERRFIRDLARTGDDVGQLNETLKTASAAEATDILDRFRVAARAAFEVPAFDEATGEGWTDEMVDALNDDFQAWMTGLKASSGTGPSTSPTSADPAVPGPSTSTPTPGPGLAPTPAPPPSGPTDAVDSGPGDVATSSSSASG